MRLNEITNDLTYGTRRSKPISQQEASEYIRANCSEALSSSPLYRYTDSIDPFLFVQPSLSNRLARNTRNYFNLLVDNLPAWHEYPKRSKSLICITAPVNKYRVFPKNGARIGVCSDVDFWYSFETKIKELGIKKLAVDDIARFLHILGRIYNIELSETNYELLINQFDELSNAIKQDPSQAKKCIDDQPFWSIPLDLLLNKPLPTLLMEICDPNANGFQLTNIKEFNITEQREVWTDSDSILIESSYLKDLNL